MTADSQRWKACGFCTGSALKGAMSTNTHPENSDLQEHQGKKTLAWLHMSSLS